MARHSEKSLAGDKRGFTNGRSRYYAYRDHRRCRRSDRILIFKPSITITRGGKILAFVSLFIFPALAGSAGISEHLERSKKTEFCTFCHVMQDYGKSLFVDDASYLPAAHFQNNRVARDRRVTPATQTITMYRVLDRS